MNTETLSCRLMSGRNRDPYDVGTEGILNLSFVVLCAECLPGEDSAEFSNSGLADFHCSRAGRRHFQLSATTVKAAIDNAKETGTAVF